MNDIYKIVITLVLITVALCSCGTQKKAYPHKHGRCVSGTCYQF